MIHREDRDAVTLLRLAHGKVNAIDLELFQELDRLLDVLAAEEPRPIVLTGDGPAFSAGVDLFRVVRDGGPYLQAFVPQLSKSLLRLFTFERPVVAAVNGHAIAGGCILACACDRRVATTAPFKIGIPELLIGVPFPTVPLEVMRAVLPAAHLQDLVLSGRTVGPEEALRMGLVDELAAPERLVERACEVARALAAPPAEIYAIGKRQLRRPAVEAIEARAGSHDAAVLELWSAERTHARIRAHLERTVGKR